MEKFDKIYVGSSPVMMLDALNSSLQKQKILIIDKEKALGGAWKSIDLFGYQGLENAVHYLLPNRNSYSFLEDIFDIELENSNRKYYAVKIFGIKLILPVKNILGKFFYQVNGGDQRESLSLKLFIKNLFKRNHVYNTKYPKNGSVPFVKSIIEALENSSVDIRLQESIIDICTIKNEVNVTTNNSKYKASNMIISHGFIPPKSFKVDNEQIHINLKKRPRPSLHINSSNFKALNSSSIPFSFSQALFPKGSIIKYVHQLSQFQNDANEKMNQHIVVVALRHDIENSYANCIKISKELEDYGLIPTSNSRSSNDFYWQDILIAQLDNDDLDLITKKGKNIIKTLYTDCLSTALGTYSPVWEFPIDYFKT